VLDILQKTADLGGNLCLDRNALIQQVKEEYARLAQTETSSHFTNQSYSGMSPEAYYEKTLEKAIRDISAGKYDDCASGLEVVERIANRKHLEDSEA
jgi:hypothetical protein